MLRSILVLAGFVSLTAGFWGCVLIAADRRNDRRHKRLPTLRQSLGDLFWFLVCLSSCTAALHSLAASFIN